MAGSWRGRPILLSLVAAAVVDLGSGLPQYGYINPSQPMYALPYRAAVQPSVPVFVQPGTAGGGLETVGYAVARIMPSSLTRKKKGTNIDQFMDGVRKKELEEQMALEEHRKDERVDAKGTPLESAKEVQQPLNPLQATQTDPEDTLPEENGRDSDDPLAGSDGGFSDLDDEDEEESETKEEKKRKKRKKKKKTKARSMKNKREKKTKAKKRKPDDGKGSEVDKKKGEKESKSRDKDDKKKRQRKKSFRTAGDTGKEEEEDEDDEEQGDDDEAGGKNSGDQDGENGGKQPAMTGKEPGNRQQKDPEDEDEEETTTANIERNKQERGKKNSHRKDKERKMMGKIEKMAKGMRSGKGREETPEEEEEEEEKKDDKMKKKGQQKGKGKKGKPEAGEKIDMSNFGLRDEGDEDVSANYKEEGRGEGSKGKQKNNKKKTGEGKEKDGGDLVKSSSFMKNGQEAPQTTDYSVTDQPGEYENVEGEPDESRQIEEYEEDAFGQFVKESDAAANRKRRSGVKSSEDAKTETTTS